MTPRLRIHPDHEALSRAAAEAMAVQIREAATARGRATVVLSGGRTPRRLYECLAADYREQIPWPSVHLFWGDERYVPSDDARSNYHMARETLLDRVPVPPGNIHPIETTFDDADVAARAYETILQRQASDGRQPRFDLVLLGLAQDGHVASLFPGSPSLDEQDRMVLAVRTDADPPVRVTLTFPAINAGVEVFFLVSGEAKARALADALSHSADLHQCPAAGVRPQQGSVTWWVDRAAAALIG